MKFLIENRQKINSIVAILILFGFVGSAMAWTAPTGNPPSNNVPAPLNVGTTSQVKDGSLGLGGLGVFGRGLFSKANNYTLPSVDFKPDFLLGVNGSIGAKEYCDETGKNCFIPSGTGPTGTVFPPGAVIAFDSETCPRGWSIFAGARGRFIVGAGTSNAPYATNLAQGTSGGSAKHVLTLAEMPSHTHQLMNGAFYGNIGNGPAWTGWNHGESYGNTSYAGGNQPHENMPPYYVLTYCRKD